MKYTQEQVIAILNRYESALIEWEQEGGDEAETEYQAARSALLELLREAIK